MGLFKRDRDNQPHTAEPAMPFTTWVIDESEYSPSDPQRIKGYRSMAAALADCVGFYRAHLDKCDGEWERDWRRLRVLEGNAVVCEVLCNSLSDSNRRRMASTSGDLWLMYRCGDPAGIHGEPAEPLVVFNRAWAKRNEPELLAWRASSAKVRYAPSAAYAKKANPSDHRYEYLREFYWCTNGDPTKPTAQPDPTKPRAPRTRARSAVKPKVADATERSMSDVLLRLGVLGKESDGINGANLEQLGITHAITCDTVERAWNDTSFRESLSDEQISDLRLVIEAASAFLSPLARKEVCHGK